jgi:hypothetical protein
MLGKIAAKTGRPVKVPDFEDIEDLTAWALQPAQAARAVKSTEDVYWPERGHEGAGRRHRHRFFMKLHHTAESKGQGRGSGAYSMDETPAKGGEAELLRADGTRVRAGDVRAGDDLMEV